jgi:hypothetical protein
MLGLFLPMWLIGIITLVASAMDMASKGFSWSSFGMAVLGLAMLAWGIVDFRARLIARNRRSDDGR